jgi:uncharacterized phage protein (TIGR01671 family)
MEPEKVELSSSEWTGEVVLYRSKYNATTLDWAIENTQDFVVQQFTGMTDSNGKDIYEGDIVRYEEYTHNRIVRWSIEAGMWEVAPINPKDYAPEYDYKKEEYFTCNGFDEASLAFNGGNPPNVNGPVFIIGNIFENPELL